MKLLIIITSLIATVSFAKDMTVEQKKTVMTWEAEMANAPILLTEKCGKGIATKMDANSFASGGFIEAEKNPGSICSGSVQVVRTLCEDTVAKPAVMKKIKSINCTAAKDKEINITLKAGTFNISWGPNATNVAEKAREYLKGNL